MDKHGFAFAPVIALGMVLASGVPCYALFEKTQGIMMEDMPPAVVRTVHLYMDGSKIVETRKTTLGRESVYSATLRKADGSEVELFIRPDGDLTSMRTRSRGFQSRIP